MNETVSALLDLQEVDLARDRLKDRRQRLPLRTELTEVEFRIADIKGRMSALQHEADTLEREERSVEEEVRLIEEKITQEEHKMYSGQVINPKEVSAIVEEVRLLKLRKAPLEEKGLEQLEARDALLTERTALSDQLVELEREAAEVRAKIDVAVAEIERELAVEEEKRSGMVGKVPTEALDLYESLRSSKRGIGVGALENGICSACREALSAVEVDRIKRKGREGEWLFRCEHCRRLLVLK